MIKLTLALVYLSLAADFLPWSNDPATRDPQIRQWLSSLMQPDNPYMSCCAEADAFEADLFQAKNDQYLATITNGKGLIKEGTTILVPNQKIKWNSGNPSGHGVIFIGQNAQIYCYVPPAGV